MSTAPHLAQLYRYPVKGLTPELLQSSELIAAENMPFDRIYAIENGPGKFDPRAPKHLPKISFLMLMRNERLAALRTHFDPETHRLTIQRDGQQVAVGDLSTALGRLAIEQFIQADMKDELRGAPKVVSAPGHAFTDVPVKCVHVVNLASIRDLERKLSRPVDPRRFRANLLVDGLEPFAEFTWLDKTITFANGVALTVFDRTVRCAATEVDPVTAQRDLAMLASLQRNYGHAEFGIYAKVAVGGSLSAGEGFGVA